MSFSVGSQGFSVPPPKCEVLDRTGGGLETLELVNLSGSEKLSEIGKKWISQESSVTENSNSFGSLCSQDIPSALCFPDMNFDQVSSFLNMHNQTRELGKQYLFSGGAAALPPDNVPDYLSLDFLKGQGYEQGYESGDGFDAAELEAAMQLSLGGESIKKFDSTPEFLASLGVSEQTIVASPSSAMIDEDCKETDDSCLDLSRCATLQEKEKARAIFGSSRKLEDPSIPSLEERIGVLQDHLNTTDIELPQEVERALADDLLISAAWREFISLIDGVNQGNFQTKEVIAAINRVLDCHNSFIEANSTLQEILVVLIKEDVALDYHSALDQMISEMRLFLQTQEEKRLESLGGASGESFVYKNSKYTSYLLRPFIFIPDKICEKIDAFVRFLVDEGAENLDFSSHYDTLVTIRSTCVEIRASQLFKYIRGFKKISNPGGGDCFFYSLIDSNAAPVIVENPLDLVKPERIKIMDHLKTLKDVASRQDCATTFCDLVWNERKNQWNQTVQGLMAKEEFDEAKSLALGESLENLKARFFESYCEEGKKKSYYAEDPEVLAACHFYRKGLIVKIDQLVQEKLPINYDSTLPFLCMNMEVVGVGGNMRGSHFTAIIKHG